MKNMELNLQANMTPEKQKTKYFSAFANKYLYPFRYIFKDGGVLGRGDKNAEWRNVTEHCLVAGAVTDILAEHLGADKKVVSAALLHDWYKRKEVEAKAAEGSNYWAITEQDEETLKKLLIEKTDFDENEAEDMIKLSHANFPKKEWVHKKSDASLEINPNRSLEEKIIHLVDEIVMGSDIVPFKERIIQQGKKERGRKFYDSFETYFGVPLDQVHITICENDQNEFEKKLGLEPGTLIDFIKNELADRIKKFE